MDSISPKRNLKKYIKAPLTVVLAQVTFMKNALTTINESTAYHALLGRQPALLPPLEGGYTASLQDDLSGRGDLYRHQARIREITAGSII